jgi:quercetin dioxygenase-like cupin family protein
VLSRQSHPQSLTMYWLIGCLAVGGLSLSVAGARGENGDSYVHVASVDRFEWESMAYPRGAEVARIYGRGLGLVRWPAGASLPTHVRDSGWHGIVVSGKLLITVEGHATQTLGSLAYFSVLDDPFSVKCHDKGPCEYFAFDTNEELVEELPGPRVLDGWTTSRSVDFEDPGFILIDLRTAKWQAVQNAPGVRRARKEANAVRARLNFVFPYWLDRGAELPSANTDDTAVYVVSGVIVLKIRKDIERRLGPGSFFRISGNVPHSSTCVGKRCVLLSTDPPPGEKNPLGRVLFPS